MGLLREVEGGWVDSRIPDIAKRLKLHDDKLTLVARCEAGGQVESYEVYWRAPSGAQMFVARFDPLAEVEQIEPTIYALDRRAKGHVESIDLIDKQNMEEEKRIDAKIRDILGEQMEHEAKLRAETELGGSRIFYGQAGSGDSPGHATKSDR